MADELRTVWRGLWRAKGVTAAATLTLAIGIAGATVMFALVDGVLLERLPVRDQDRLIVAWKRMPGEPTGHGAFGATSVRAVQDNTRLLEAVAPFAYNGAMEFLAVDNGVASNLRTAAVGGDFFRVLGTEAILGRTLQPQDDVNGAEFVLVIGEGEWRRRYGAARDVIGRRLTLRQQPFVIVGVVPDVEIPRGARAWIAMRTFTVTTTAAFRVAGTRDHDLVARLRPGVSIEQAASELQSIAAEVERTHSDVFPRGAVPYVQSYETTVVGDVRRPVLVLFAAVGLVLLVAGANVANLVLLQGEARRLETAMRVALGAARGRLLGRVLIEGILLGVLGAAVAIALSWWTLEGFVALSPTELPRLTNVRIDLRVLTFAALVGIASAAFASVGSSLITSRIEPAAELRSGRTATGGTRRGRRALVVAQVAWSLIMVVAAGVLTRTLLRLQTLDMGMATDRLVFVELFFPEDKYPVDKRRPFFDQLLPQLRGVPGIDSVSPVGVRPYAGLSGWDVPRFVAEGQDADAAAANPALNLEAVHPEHFTTLAVRLLRGRGVEASDTKSTALVTVVSDDVARRVWPRQDPIGKRIKMGSAAATGSWFTVVGVAESIRYRELAGPPSTMYVAAAQFIDAAGSVAIRSSASLDVLAGVVRDRVRAIDPSVYVIRVDPFSTFLARPLARPRFVAWLSNIFGAIALLLAAVGLYGVLAAFVRHSTREIGVRVALGASARDVRRLVVGEASWLAGIGVAIGLAGSAATSGLLRGMLFGVAPIDPVTMSLAVGVLVLTAAAACYVPVRRALRVDAVALLRAN